MTDSAGRLIAHGTSRCVIFPPSPDVPALPAQPPPVIVEEDSEWIAPFRRPVRGEVRDQEIWQSRSGLDILRAQIAGELPQPPLHHLLGDRPTRAEDGTCAFAMPASAWITSPSGFVREA